MLIGDMKVKDVSEAVKRSLSVKIDGCEIGKLVPIGEWILKDDELVEEFSKWRAGAMTMFFSQFTSTPEKARSYLQVKSIDRSDCILFMIMIGDLFVGHIGLSDIRKGVAEIDNLMIGISTNHTKLALASERSLIEWAFTDLGLNELYGRILSSNFLAMDIHKSLGFKIVTSLPLRKIEHLNGSTLTVCDPADSEYEFKFQVIRLKKPELQ